MHMVKIIGINPPSLPEIGTIPKIPVLDTPIESIDRFRNRVPTPDKIISNAVSDLSDQVNKAASAIESAPDNLLSDTMRVANESKDQILLVPGDFVTGIKDGVIELPKLVPQALDSTARLPGLLLTNLGGYIKTGVEESVDISKETDYIKKREKIRTLFDIIPF